jgi:hypothetical protein
LRLLKLQGEMAMYLKIETVAEVDRYMDRLRISVRRTQGWIAAQSGDPLDFRRRMKFDPVGYHPIEDRAINLIEQINQTWTYAVALAAARQLLDLHPDVGGFRLAPGAHASLALDIMSEAEGQVGALTLRPELHRDVFFMSPEYPTAQRLPKFERDGVQVWSVVV